MFRLIGRFFAFIFTLLFVVFAFASVISGMTLTSAKTLLTGEYLMSAISQDVSAGKVMNLVKGKNTYNEDASFAQIALEKLDDATIEKYNLTEENMEALMETEKFSAFISGKMTEAVNAAASGETFEMNSAEVVDVLRESEAEFTAITGVELDDTKYDELQKAVEDAGVKQIAHDFSGNSSSGSGNPMEYLRMAKELLQSDLDLIMYGAAGVCFLFILLFNLRKKRRVFFYSGIVILGAGMIFTKLDTLLSMAFHNEETSSMMQSLTDLVTGAAERVGESAVTIGFVLLVLYVACIVLSIVKGIFFRRRR